MYISEGVLFCRHVHVAEECSLPPSTAGLLQLLHCEPFCRLLSHLTGLDLAQNIIRLDTQGENEGEPCSSSAISNGSSNGGSDAGGEIFILILPFKIAYMSIH